MVISDWLKRWAFRVRKKVQFCSQTAEIKTENVDQYDWGVQERPNWCGHEMYTWQDWQRDDLLEVQYLYLT